MTRKGDTALDEIPFVNNFWDKDDKGFSVIQARMKDSLETLQELLGYYQERIQVEKEYNKRLLRLNKRPLGSHETGSLKISLDKLNYENNQMVKHNNKFVETVNKKNIENLQEFYNRYHKRISVIEGHMNKVLKKKHDGYRQMEACKQKFQQESAHIKNLRLTLHTTLGKELDKNTAKLNKLSASISTTSNNYERSIRIYSELNDIYIRDWKIALLDFYSLETERIQLCKINCFNYCNNIATLCVENDQSVDLARSVFAQIQPIKDLQEFSNNYGTGNEIYEEPQFIDFMNGYDDYDYKPKYFLAGFENPNADLILSRTYSRYSNTTQTNNMMEEEEEDPVIRQSKAPASTLKDGLPEINLPPPVPPEKPRNMRKKPPSSPILSPLTKSASAGSGYSSTHEGNDIFSGDEAHHKDKLATSNGSSEYSNPTNYSSSTERNWNSPRRKSKQLSDFQEQINLKVKDIASSPKKNIQQDPPKIVPISKDFSVDFIAKALEDLNSGGNGDINRFRRSVRLEEANKEKTAINGKEKDLKFNLVPSSDLIDDHEEVATRYNSINFKTPGAVPTKKPRPKSMIDSLNMPSASNDLVSTVVKTKSKNRHLFGASTKSYHNLQSMIHQKFTPVTRAKYISKARAKYAYMPQQEGELYFKKGWNMYIIHKQEDNWFLCELGGNCKEKTGAVGLVPGNYLIEGEELF